MSLEYSLTYGNIPFVGDMAHSLEEIPGSLGVEGPYRPLSSLLEEVNRLLPWQYLNDYAQPNLAPGHNLDALAFRDSPGPFPNSTVRVGEWFYPTGAGRWSVFRGLTTSSMVKAMRVLAQPATFVMKVNPISPGNPGNTQTLYTLSTPMYMLPPRPLGEHEGSFDGLFLITLVDERFYFQGSPVSLKPNQNTTWSSLISQLASALGITLAIQSPVEGVYGQPEPDSQIWVNFENAAFLLDSVASSVGRMVVRKMSGTYALYTPRESLSIVQTNRGDTGKVVRLAGGDLFYSGRQLPAGSLLAGRNQVVPASVSVTFPKYVIGDDPVPHYLNPRYANQRPGCWYEESFGDVFSVSIPISSGGSLVSGVVGTSTSSIHSTAKALLSGEIQTTPLNVSGLTSLALRLAGDYYDAQVAASLDEVYPGTLVWAPEGLHDIVWTYSESRGLASTRVVRGPWTAQVREMQHGHAPLSGSTVIPPGVGGRSVSQAWRDSVSGTPIFPQLSAPLVSGALSVGVSDCSYLPTDNYWKGTIGVEKILFGPTSGLYAFDIVTRGIDGSLTGDHASGESLILTQPDVTYGVNLVSFGKGQYVFPGVTTSGGVCESRVIPQVQTVRLDDGTPTAKAGLNFYLGTLLLYDPGNVAINNQELVWIYERNNYAITSGRSYEGHFQGYSHRLTTSGTPRPVYAINEYPSSGGGGTGGSVTINNATYTINTTWIITGGTTTVTNNTWTYDSTTFVIFNGVLEVCGDLFWCCTNYTFVSSSVSEWTLPAHKVVFNVTANGASTTVSSIKPNLVDGVNTGPQLIVVNNVGTGSIILNDQTTGSGTAGERIQLPPEYGTSVTLAQFDTIILWYDTCATTKVWRVLSCTVVASSTLANNILSLQSAYTVTAAWANVGLTITLPSAGTYLITYCVAINISGTMGMPAVETVECRLNDTTAGTVVSHSDFYVFNELNSTQIIWRVVTVTTIYSVAASHVIDLQAIGANLPTAAALNGAVSDPLTTTLSYVKIG